MNLRIRLFANITPTKGSNFMCANCTSTHVLKPRNGWDEFWDTQKKCACGANWITCKECKEENKGCVTCQQEKAIGCETNHQHPAKKWCWSCMESHGPYQAYCRAKRSSCKYCSSSNCSGECRKKEKYRNDDLRGTGGFGQSHGGSHDSGSYGRN